MKLLRVISVVIIAICVISCANDNGKIIKTTKTEVKTDNNENIGALVEISAEDLLKMLKYDKNAFVIDVRKADKSIRSCKLIDGYKHLEDSLVYKNPDLLPKEKTIVLLSKDGIRSKNLGKFLSNKGMTVYNVKGGMDSYWEWRANIIREKLNIYDKEIDVIELYADDFGC